MLFCVMSNEVRFYQIIYENFKLDYTVFRLFISSLMNTFAKDLNLHFL